MQNKGKGCGSSIFPACLLNIYFYNIFCKIILNINCDNIKITNIYLSQFLHNEGF